jgi:Glycosyl transferase family 2
VRLVTTTVLRNEADILEAFVRHHAAFADRMIVACHFCQDASTELARELQREGLPLDVRELPEPIYEEARFKTAVFDEAARVYDPEWILPLDADEFLVYGDAPSLDAALDRLPRNLPTRLRLKAYVPTPDDEEAEPNVLRRITNRSAMEFGSKVIVPRDLRRRRRIGIAQGHHHVYERNTGRAIPHVDTDAVSIAHFPIRSAAQYRRRILGAWPSARAAPEFRPGSSIHWEHAYHALAAETLTRERFIEIARSYNVAGGGADETLVRDPVESTFEIRYPHEDPSPETVLALTAEGVAAAVHALARRAERSSSRRLLRVLDWAARVPAKIAAAARPLSPPSTRSTSGSRGGS